MPEETLFRFEQSMARSDVATYLRRVADALDGEGTLTLSAGEESASPSVPERVTFEVTVERETDARGERELSVEFELEWDENASGTPKGSLSIE